MCNHGCGNFCGCGCANSLVLLWLGASLGRRCCERERRCFCVTSCSGCRNTAHACTGSCGTNDGFDRYYARQYGLFPCDRACRRCGNDCGCNGTVTTRNGCGCGDCDNDCCNNCVRNNCGCCNNCTRNNCGCCNNCVRNNCGC
ncbi:MAG: hypothetical protein SPH68_07970 [Candidatus Borkfalkiaceae bacterium]|nr:hypothetical protein [Clostridia bacterium]MDY6224077.1 hypothetical protein [Christensenellaceae bacterium]